MKKGFTLVEIMIVVAIIGILASISIVSMMKTRSSAFRNICLNNLRQIETAKNRYALDYGLTNNQPIGLNDNKAFQLLVGKGTGYLRTFPLCPASHGISQTNRTAGLSAGDYSINPIGSNPACKYMPHAHILH